MMAESNPTNRARFCPECGSAVPENARFCKACGTELRIEEPEKKQEEPTVTVREAPADEPPAEQVPVSDKTAAVERHGQNIAQPRSRGILAGFATTLVSLCLIVSAVMLMILVVLYTLSCNVTFPSVGWLTELLATPYLAVLNGVLVGIFLLLIVLINIKRFRRVFLSIGVSFVLSGVLSAGLGLFYLYFTECISGNWHDLLIMTGMVLQDLAFVCAIAFLLLGAVFLSVYSCILGVRGEKYEENT